MTWKGKSWTKGHYLFARCGGIEQHERSQRPHELVAHKFPPISDVASSYMSLRWQGSFSTKREDPGLFLRRQRSEDGPAFVPRLSNCSREQGRAVTARQTLEMKDPVIKLFGKTICLPVKRDVLDKPSWGARKDSVSEAGDPSSRDHRDSVSADVASQEQRDGREGEEIHRDKASNDKYEEGTSCWAVENPKDLTDSTSNNQKDETGREISSPTARNKTERETSILQETTPKKPDKKLACPRCNSRDTKFCYYNNYNLNQPRHLCRNCQRYWTAGGTMRNIPIGAGRRKSKNSYAALFHHMGVPESLQAGDLKSTGTTILKFGSEFPNCSRSAAPVPSTVNRLVNPGQAIPCSGRGVDGFGDERSSGSCLTASNSMEKVSEKVSNRSTPEPAVRNHQGFPWDSGHWNSTSALSTSGIPVSFYQVPQCYWAYALPGSLNAASRASLLPSSLSQGDLSTSPPSLMKLGKHSRDGNVWSPGNGTWTPMTYPIEDCGVATKKLIVRAREVLEGASDSGKSDRLISQAFQSNVKGKSFNDGRTILLQANPAALCRSMNFQEST